MAITKVVVLILMLLFGMVESGCAHSACPSLADREGAPEEINQLLDDWYDAASKADEARYMGHLSDDCVFLGTDKSERWSKAGFLAYVHPYFSKGDGWTYTSRDRHVAFSDDGKTAWFDERLDSENYGELRGTGVLRYAKGTWKIVHYSIVFPIPNDLSKTVVLQIKEHENGE